MKPHCFGTVDKNDVECGKCVLAKECKTYQLTELYTIEGYALEYEEALRSEAQLEKDNSGTLVGKSFVFTGGIDLKDGEKRLSRVELFEKLTSLGATCLERITSTSKPDYLVRGSTANIVDVKTSKEQLAEAYNVPIIEEKTFLDWYNNTVRS